MTVTQYVSSFCNEFEADKIATSLAKKQGKTKESILQEWENNKNLSVTQGRKFEEDIVSSIENSNHNIIGNYTYVENVRECVSRLCKLENKFETQVSLKGVVKDIDLYGTCDLLSDDCVIELKYAKLKTSNNYNKMKQEYSNFDDCNLFSYSLQLLCYLSMIDRYPLKSYLLGLDKGNDNKMFHVGFQKDKNKISLTDFCVGGISKQTNIQLMGQLNNFIKIFSS